MTVKSEQCAEEEEYHCHSCCFLTPPFFMNSRPKGGKYYKPTFLEDVANVLTHGIFIVPCIWLGMVLYELSISREQSTTAVVYGGSLVQLLTLSTFHHIMSLIGRTFSRLGRIAHRGDRVGIFIFIAASYTPWLALRSYNSTIDPYIVLYAIWAIVIIGLLCQIFFHETYSRVEVAMYVAVGLGPSIVIIESICFNGWEELAIGGAVYISGVFFYKLDGILPFAHAIWHLFVIAAALTHYYAVYANLYKNRDLCDQTRPFFLKYIGL